MRWKLIMFIDRHELTITAEFQRITTGYKHILIFLDGYYKAHQVNGQLRNPTTALYVMT